MPRILIADCHCLYRTGFRKALESLIPGTDVLEADNIGIARELLKPDGNINLFIADLDTPGASLETLREVHEAFPKTPLAAIASLATRADILCSLEAGLHGFVSKSQPDSEILGAIQDMLTGRIYVPSALARIGGIIAYASKETHRDGLRDPAQTELRMQKLTRRQRDILPLLAKGLSNKEIARTLKIAEGTTKIHASSLLRVLGVRNRTEAAVVAGTSYLSDQSISSFPTERVPALIDRRR
jgi:DNA-binding NarL/FixJ family response regulator